MRVRFLQPGGGDTHELAAGLQIRHGASAHVEHGLAQASDQLVHHRGERATVRDLAFDALGDQLLIGRGIGLEVAVLGVGGVLAPGLHGAERPHAAVGLELLAVHEDQISRGFGGAGQQRAEHHRIGAGHQGLADVPGVLQAAVGDQRHPGRDGGLGRFVDGGNLRDTHTGHHTGGADGARAHPDLDGIRAGVDQCLGALAGGGLAADDVHVGRGGIGLEPGDHFQHALAVAVGGVHHQCVHAGVDQGHGALVSLAEEAHGGGHTQPAFVVLGGQRVLLGLVEILDGDQTGQVALVVNQRQLLDTVLTQQLDDFVARHPDLRGDQRHAGHHLVDLGGQVLLAGHEAGVAVGDDAQQLAVLIHHRKARYPVLGAQFVPLVQGGARVHGDRVGDHARFAALDLVDLGGLVLDGQVAVDHADTALACQRDGHAGFGDGVHGGGADGGLDVDALGEPGGGVRIGGDHIRWARQQQHVVVGESFKGKGVELSHVETFRAKRRLFTW